jgi:hypothetical protein
MPSCTAAPAILTLLRLLLLLPAAQPPYIRYTCPSKALLLLLRLLLPPAVSDSHPSAAAESCPKALAPHHTWSLVRSGLKALNQSWGCRLAVPIICVMALG